MKVSQDPDNYFHRRKIFGAPYQQAPWVNKIVASSGGNLFVVFRHGGTLQQKVLYLVFENALSTLGNESFHAVC
jgi:hypothetical protein